MQVHIDTKTQAVTVKPSVREIDKLVGAMDVLACIQTVECDLADVAAKAYQALGAVAAMISGEVETPKE